MNVNDVTMKNTSKQTKHNSLFTNKLLGDVTKTAGIEVFWIPKKMRALSWEQVVSYGSFPKIRIDPRALLNLRIVPENKDRSKSAPQLNLPLARRHVPPSCSQC